MPYTFRKLLILFVAYLSVSAEICRFSPKLHEEFFNIPEDGLKRGWVKMAIKDLGKSFEKIHNFSTQNLSVEECKKANSIMQSYGEAVMNAAYSSNIEEYERNKIIQAITETALKIMLFPLLFKNITKPPVNPDHFYEIMKCPPMTELHFYFSAVADIRNHLG
jgi:hypothetical protein